MHCGNNKQNLTCNSPAMHQKAKLKNLGSNSSCWSWMIHCKKEKRAKFDPYLYTMHYICPLLHTTTLQYTLLMSVLLTPVKMVVSVLITFISVCQSAWISTLCYVIQFATFWNRSSCKTLIITCGQNLELINSETCDVLYVLPYHSLTNGWSSV